MSGNVDNARLWANADVYIDPSGTAAIPADVETEWGTGWNLVGLLDGEEGFTETRDQETTDLFAWGGILVRRTKTKYVRSLGFVALEDNETVFSLVNPGSPAPTVDGGSGLTTRKIQVPKPKKIKAGFELRENDRVKRRFTETSWAELSEVDERTESETALAVYTVTLVLYPDADGNLYSELIGTVTA